MYKIDFTHTSGLRQVSLPRSPIPLPPLNTDLNPIAPHTGSPVVKFFVIVKLNGVYRFLTAMSIKTIPEHPAPRIVSRIYASLREPVTRRAVENELAIAVGIDQRAGTVPPPGHGTRLDGVDLHHFATLNRVLREAVLTGFEDREGHFDIRFLDPPRAFWPVLSDISFCVIDITSIDHLAGGFSFPFGLPPAAQIEWEMERGRNDWFCPGRSLEWRVYLEAFGRWFNADGWEDDSVEGDPREGYEPRWREGPEGGCVRDCGRVSTATMWRLWRFWNG